MSSKEVVVQIIKTYEENLFSLHLKYQYHWSLRRWRLSGDKKYLQPIFNDLQRRTMSLVPKIKKLGWRTPAAVLGRRMLESYHASTPKKKNRLKVYQRSPEVLFYINLIHYLFLVKTYKLNNLPGLAVFYQKATRHLARKVKKISRLLFSKSLITHNPSAVANSVYYLKFLKIADHEEKLLQTFKTFWLKKKAKNDLDWENKIYALTHVIIAASYFYQRFLEAERFIWILDFFEKNFKEIAKNTNPDIVAEVGLCFKLCRKQSPTLKKAQKFVLDAFDTKAGYVVREKTKNSLEKAEHRNILAVLLLSEYKGFVPGPDLQEFIKTSKRKLYLPQKGKYIGLEEVD